MQLSIPPFFGVAWYKEYFVAGRGGGDSKNLKIRGSAWVSRPALVCECFILNTFRGISLNAWYFQGSEIWQCGYNIFSHTSGTYRSD